MEKEGNEGKITRAQPLQTSTLAHIWEMRQQVEANTIFGFNEIIFEQRGLVFIITKRKNNQCIKIYIRNF